MLQKCIAERERERVRSNRLKLNFGQLICIFVEYLKCFYLGGAKVDQSQKDNSVDAEGGGAPKCVEETSKMIPNKSRWKNGRRKH